MFIAYYMITVIMMGMNTTTKKKFQIGFLEDNYILLKETYF